MVLLYWRYLGWGLNSAENTMEHSNWSTGVAQTTVGMLLFSLLAMPCQRGTGLVTLRMPIVLLVFWDGTAPAH